MPNSRPDMTVRIVSLSSPAASDSRVGGTAAQRVALVTSLSEQLWALTRQPLPAYTRASMPIVLSALGAPSQRD